MTSKRVVFVLAAMTMAAPAAAQENDLQVYAAMAKLEANVAEAAGGLLLHHMLPAGEARDAAAEDFRNDSDAIEDYVSALEGMDLADDQEESIVAFKSRWDQLDADARALLDEPAAEAGGDEALRRVQAWWASAGDVDDLIDDELEDILEANDAEIETN